ncbi:MAG: digeranylgeranylglycerophospholipid reductase [Candidatus Aenigmarchaeota archaeon ex4484_56]|nr:MAG: digeranylgeranylglycerophospholipid reductase [Candidatus Aenigmarchaeota archaeon ex4484_56]
MSDVIVVGAGPGGCATAKFLAIKGYNVIVYEKRQEIGSPKRCAEGISLGGLERLGLKPPSNCIRQKINGARIYAPNGKYIEIDYGKDNGYILERKVFDKWLAEEAVRAGAEVQAKTNIEDVIKKDNTVSSVKGKFCGKNFEEKCKFLVGADGVESKIARKVGLNTTCNPMLIDSGAQFEMAGIDIEDPKKIYLYFGNKIAPRGYCWIFPKGKDVANVGIGIIGNSEIPAITYLKNFVDSFEELKKGSILEVNSGGIPVGGLLKEMTMYNFLVVGDAAHQVNPIHGGGIYEAQFAGRLAAEVIDEALQNNDFNLLKKFDKLWWEQRGVYLSKVEKLREVVEKLSDDDLNYLAENLHSEDLINFGRGQKLTILAKVLMKRPSLIRLAKLLI